MFCMPATLFFYMAEPAFSQVIVTEIPKRAEESGTVSITVPSGKFWKIESAGIGATNGTVYLKTGTELIAILFTSTNGNMHSSYLPVWLPQNFSGELVNDSSARAMVSITEWSV
jgi:hypothetical protein